MSKLNQVIAVEKGTRARAERDLTEVDRLLSKPTLLEGQARTYEPLHEDGDRIPGEVTKVQVSAQDAIAQAVKAMTELFDVTATKDWTNCKARADVVVDGVTIIAHVPATYLLFLEKQLIGIRTFISRLPTLDPAFDWEPDPSNELGGYRSKPTESLRTKKVMRNHVLAEATKEHPAQVQIYHEDVPVGTWTQVKFSGALPATRVRLLTDRVEKLQAAVKHAREEANMVDADQQKVGDAFFTYLFS